MPTSVEKCFVIDKEGRTFEFSNITNVSVEISDGRWDASDFSYFVRPSTFTLSLEANTLTLQDTQTEIDPEEWYNIMQGGDSYGPK